MPRYPGTSGRPLLRLVGLLIAFGVCSLPVFLGTLNHDEAWHLVGAERLVAGQRLYVDHFDTNPPLIVWLNLGPVLLARTVGISAILALRLLVLALVAVSLALIRWTLVRILPDRPRASLLILLLALFVLVPLVGYHFAQREHLMLILVLPYLIMAAARASGEPLVGLVPWIVGLLAGVGLSIKPQFLLLGIAVEATLILHRGWRIILRPEVVTIAAVGLSYGLAILTITPEYLPWIRRITSIYYGAGRASFPALASQPGTIFTLFAVLGFLVLRPQGQARQWLAVILAASVSLLAIAVIQIKGYPYQFYPALAVGILLIGWLLVELEHPRPDQSRIVTLIRICLAILILSVAAGRVRESIGWRGHPELSDTELGRMIRASKEHAGGGSVFVFSPVIEAGFTMVNYSGVGWASRHPALLFLPGCYPSKLNPGPIIAFHPPDKMSDGEHFLFESVITKLLADRPTLLFVDETGTPLMFDGRRFDYLGYYAQDPRFVDFFRDYEPFTQVDQFRVYRRKNTDLR